MATLFSLLSNVRLSNSNLSFSCANYESYDMKGDSSLQSKWLQSDLKSLI
jgi:hypothetical protein